MIFAIATSSAYCQMTGDELKLEQSNVNHWIYEHPEVKLISKSDFISASVAERNELIGLNMRLLHEFETPTWSEIQAFETSGYQSGLLDMAALSTEVQQVKEWMIAHPNIKILTTSQFARLNAEERAEVLASTEIIICSETLTMSDIQAFEAN